MEYFFLYFMLGLLLFLSHFSLYQIFNKKKSLLNALVIFLILPA